MLVERIHKLEEEMKKLLDNSRGEIHAELFKILDEEVFKKYPDIKNIGWTQYTPYFNDGEPCEFGVNTYGESIYINGEPGYDLSEEIYKSQEEVRDVISKIIDGISDNILKTLYDEGLVFIYNDGTFEVEDYDHG